VIHDQYVDEEEPFRCLRCGSLLAIDAPGMLTLGMKNRPIDAAAPSCACGGRRWVRANSFTEHYMFWRRSDVCRIGGHVDPRTRHFHLVPRGPRLVGEHPQVAGVDVNVCPDHEPELRANGVLGCFPDDDVR
jgi:hypothetical protein